MKYKNLILASLLSITPQLNNISSLTQEKDFLNKNSNKELLEKILNHEEKEKIQNKLTKYDSTKNYWKTQYPENYVEELKNLKQKLVTRGHTEEEIKILFRNASIDEKVTNFFRKNILKKSDKGEITFEEYSRRVGLNWFVDNAQEFADKYEKKLLDVQKNYGVDARYIVGIIGIETKYGDNNNMGSHNLINSLVTQYVTTRRKTFSERELHYVLELSKKYEEDLTNIPCSYAGAFGVGQWIPSSIYNYSEINNIDDLFSIEGTMPSIANYLKIHGWDETKNNEDLKTRGKNWKAIRAYNHSDTYVKAVDKIAQGVKIKDETTNTP